MKQVTTIILFFIFSTSAFGQSIKGKVIAQEGEPLPFANAAAA